ncbi:histone deacetylase family protein [Flammeovirga kamogawensis]|uniref:Histone deacetylase n=1 Tax=Flammeovirga kamogawensis TaxID=373891 RepID=A0ABX8GS02_9BACT|nr:histone deacetylase [Flammeovirga kamogawensis]MBB6462013.1 acetoin utilization deacetylase AcuC-like enzyme [Flammeovirga kamogawensis]QWG05750.1 histone deacetylase [Flammeovirga kamogawensis]TRX67575.1 histone deacetylase [Flammeovirga kamogawensis]
MLKIAYHERYGHPVEKGHRFPMDKYPLLVEQLIYEGTITNENLFEPLPVSAEFVLATHTEEYWKKLIEQTLSYHEARKIGLPMSEDLILRELIITQGTIDCTKFALQYGVAMNIAGGTHHAYTDHGEGFCILNDFGVAANYLINQKGFSKILIIDLDVHQGNGTAEIFKDNPKVFTFSMHGANNYPMHKEKSDLDIPLNDNTSDSEYLNVLNEQIDELFSSIEPEFVFYLSGVDILKTDKLGKLGLSIQGCKERDEIVFKKCSSYNTPVAVSMGGGYSKSLRFIVEAHANTFRVANNIYF